MRHLEPLISKNAAPQLRGLLSDTWFVGPSELPRVGRMQADGRVGVVLGASGAGAKLRLGALRADGDGTRVQTAAPARGESLIGVRFEPGAFRSLFGLPYRDFIAGRVSPELVAWEHRLGAVLRELVRGSLAFEQSLPDVVSPIVPLVREPDAAWTRIAEAVQLLSERDFRADSSALARRCGWSRRQFERQFAEHVGMSPKVFRRTQRVGHARKLLRSGANLAETAQRLGFSDQAHLTREFRWLLGVTPLEYQRKAF